MTTTLKAVITMMSFEEYKEIVQVVEYLSPDHRYGNSKMPFLFLERDDQVNVKISSKCINSRR